MTTGQVTAPPDGAHNGETEGAIAVHPVTDVKPVDVQPVAPATNGNGKATATAVKPASPVQLMTATELPSDFRFGAVDPVPATTIALAAEPPLGPLAAFVGTWQGSGFNTIFRPNNPGVSPTQLPLPPVPPTDNVLELNLTRETLSFSPALGSVPNRGELQGDIFLNGVPYLQTVQDVTTGKSVGIHVEPGIWMCVPSTNDPSEPQNVVRMGSIPHGTTICAQGTFSTVTGAPTIGVAAITPFIAGSGGNITFPSQTASESNTERIPQDLASFIASGKITQAILDDPNTVLRNAIAGQTILRTTTIQISTSPLSPLFGGGTDNIAFLLGDAGALTNPNPAGQNAQSVQMHATFWIEEVSHRIVVPVGPASRTLKLQPEPAVDGQVLPTFVVRPPVPITDPRPIMITSTQIQYSQTVLLNFNGLSWPHVSVATLVPTAPISVPPSVWQ